MDPSPINGEVYYFINQLSGLQMDLNGNATTPGSPILQNTKSFSDLSQRWATSKMPDGKWKISNVLSGLCLDSTGGTNPTTVQNTCGINVATQEWTFTYASNYAAYANTANGYSAITNAGTGQVLSVSGGSVSTGADLVQTALSGGTPTGSQLWLFRPAFWRGDDMSEGEKEEYDRSADTCASNGGSVGVGTCNDYDFPWWHDAYLPGQDILQIYKNAGLNSIRIRPASINAVIVHGDVSFDLTTGPYSGYTLNGGTSTTFPMTEVTQLIPQTATSAQYVAMSDWAGVDLAVRAKKLGMSVFLDLFYDGDNSSDSPGNWATATLASLEGTPTNENGGNGQNLMYNYVKQEIELFRANGAMPDMVALGNEVNLGMFTSLGPTGSKVNYTPNSSQAAAIQIAGMQAVLDAAADTSNPALLGNPVAPPLRCIDVDGTPDLQTFFYAATVTYKIPLDTACQSYYPGWGGPLTQAQYNWVSCGNSNCSAAQHVEEANILAETNIGVVGTVSPGGASEGHMAVGLPVYAAETGIAYTNVGGDTPLDDWYGSYLAVTPNPASRQIARQAYIDFETVQENNPYHLGMGIDCWACESTPLSSDGGLSNGLLSSTNGGAGSDWGGVYEYWKSAQDGLFDNSNSITPGSAAGDFDLDNATLPAMIGIGGKTDPTYTYMLVNATNGEMLETALASTAADAPLDMAVYNGIVSQHQQWKILSQGGNAEVNTAVYTCTTTPCSSTVKTKAKTGASAMNNLGDGYFQIVNQNQAGGVYVLDNQGNRTAGSAVVQNTQGSLPTAVPANSNYSNQEWDIMTVGNCGDIPANCTNPPLTTLGDYYVIVNKASGLLLAVNGTTIDQEEPAAASNGDWIVPSSKGQLWQIVPVHISAASTPAVLAFASAPPTSLAAGGNLGTINVDVLNTAKALIESPSESVTLNITGPASFSQTLSTSAAAASFNLSSVAWKTPGVYTVTASASGLTNAKSTFSVVAAPTVVITATSTLSGTASSGYTATIKLTNSGTGAASNVAITTATLGGVSGSALPQSIGPIAANGGTAIVTVNFPGSVGADNAKSAEVLGGSYTGGAFSASIRATLP